jgi:hypothetical protein
VGEPAETGYSWVKEATAGSEPRRAPDSKAVMAASSSLESVRVEAAKFSRIREAWLDLGITMFPEAKCQARTTCAVVAVEVGTAAQRAIGFHGYAQVPALLRQFRLLVAGVQLNLVDGRDNFCGLQQIVQVVCEEVGDTDGPDLVVFIQPLHLLPGLDVQVLGRHRPMDEVQVHVIQAEDLAAVLECCLGPVLFTVPELGGDKDVLARNAGGCDRCSNSGLVAVGGSRVDVAVSSLEGVLHGALGIPRRYLENTETKLGYGDAVVQCQL